MCFDIIRAYWGQALCGMAIMVVVLCSSRAAPCSSVLCVGCGQGGITESDFLESRCACDVGLLCSCWLTRGQKPDLCHTVRPRGLLVSLV